MGKHITRRHLLKFAGGSAAGVLLTPIPWKTVDDIAIWSQNWSWIPRPLQGELRTRFTACSLCSAGCGVRAHCVGSQPVGLSGVPSHPASRGSLCPVGLGGHHLAYHPQRLLQPVQLKEKSGGAEVSPVSPAAAMEMIVRVFQSLRSGAASGAAAVLDQVPGRTMSRIYRRFLGSIHGGVYISEPGADAAGFEIFRRMLASPWGQPGLDLENSATLLSFGAPVFDGWGAPGRVAGIASAQDAGVGRRLKVIHVESRRSRTAAASDLWLPVNPGAEATLAFGLAHVLIREKLIDETRVRDLAPDFDGPEDACYRGLVQKFTPEAVSGITGLTGQTIIDLARELAQRTPAVVVGCGDPGGGTLGEEEGKAIWGLNLLLGSVGRKGGIVARQEMPDDPALSAGTLAPVTRLADLPDHSLRLLILDPARSGSATPWPLIERKLVSRDALVVSMSPVLAGDARRANLVLPSPAFLELLEEAPVAADSPAGRFSLCHALLPAPSGIVGPDQVIGRIASALSINPAADGEELTLAACLRRKAEAIRRSARGTVFSPADGKTVPVGDLDAPEKFRQLLEQGGIWVDSASEPEPPSRCSLLGGKADSYAAMAKAGEGRLAAARESEAGYPLVLMSFGMRGVPDDAQVSPLMTKLFQESGLRRLLNQADINPATARAAGLGNRASALVETASGSVRVEIRLDPGVMPGVIHVALGPSGSVDRGGRIRDKKSVLEICRTDQGSVWRLERARVREA